MIGMITEAIGFPNISSSLGSDHPSPNEYGEGPNDETTKFLKFLQDAESPSYPGCEKFTQLSFIIRLLHLKVLSGWTNRSFTLLLELLKEAMPSEVKLPSSYYDAQKITVDLGFTYKTWDACPKSCMLFRNEDEKLDACDICDESRYKEVDRDSSNRQTEGKRIPVKQVRYFPLVPRLQRLFMSSKTSSFMNWHLEGHTDDGVLRHPADNSAWKEFDKDNSDFASDSHNIRLGLAANGFNPFITMSTTHSTWPVVLIPYNLPPLMCMKQPFFMLSVLIDDPKGPGNKIDVYLQPLIEELKEFWHEGVLTYDALSNEMFKLHAALLWTINDFPAFGNLSGWSTRGEKACPCCNRNTKSHWLSHGRKYCYMGHR
ncbi:hypothetical protein LWI28_022235 [Acer negundo]|uniref:Transposase n=1 Tax=Acer negundo TaxID=4023 RepID=A0AAD5NXG4_ACENE|nr:hypothetical protein LWI28_022235 [Acer negundo]